MSLEIIDSLNFKKWFGDWENNPEAASKVVDQNGRPLVVHHGSDSEFNEFSSKFIGQTGTQHGQGFYFTSDKGFAGNFGKKIKSFFLNIRKPLSTDELTLSYNDCVKLIDAIDKRQCEDDPEFGYGILSDYGDVDSYGREKVLKNAAELEYSSADNDVEIVGSLINASGDYDIVVNTLYSLFGYDGIICPERDIFIIHHPNQAKEVSNTLFNNNSNNMYEGEKSKRIFVTESQYKRLKEHAELNMLLEDTRTNVVKKQCLHIIRNHFNNASWLDTVFNHNDNPEGLTYIDYMFKQFMSEFYHNPDYRKKATMRLAPLFCRLAFESNFQNNNPDTTKLNRLLGILNFIYQLMEKNKLDVSKISLDLTYEELNNQFGAQIDQMNKDEDERMNNAQYTENSEYTVIGPVDFKTANKYGDYSCPSSKLCYTQSESTWNNNYTNYDKNSAYIILKNGWENMEANHDDNSESAYDTYGLSMIFVFVDEQGKLEYCNTRWNHKAKYAEGFSCDHAMSREMISELIGRPFNEVFKPTNRSSNKIEALKNMTEIPEDYFCSSKIKEITIPNNITSIGDGAFYKCSSLKSVTIPDSVTKIGGFAFGSCKSLTSVTIGKRVTSIGECAFYNCTSLKSVTMPDSVTSIEGEAFRYCTSLTSVTIPDSVTSIGNGAFKGCTSLTSVTMPIRFRDKINDIFRKTNVNVNFYGQQNESLNKNTKKIFITESQYKQLINESQESKSIDAAKKLLISNGYTPEQADKFIRIDLRNDIPSLRDSKNAKFILGVTRMFLNKELSDATTILNIDKTIKLLALAHYNEYDRNLNGLSAEELINRFADARSEQSQEKRNALSSRQFEQRDYNIVRINSFEEASRYSNYTSWCVTHSEGAFDSYTANGEAQFYFCLKNGFEKIKPIEGENCPLDEYGLSMIAVCVDGDGDLKTCTCRWNHDKGGNDNIMDEEQISNVVGVNFYQTFKPSNVLKEKIEALKNMTEIPEDYFCSSKIKEITIPNNITSIGKRAFEDCASLASVSIPDSVTEIRLGTFSGCESLTSIIIPNSVTEIGGYAFAYCSNLTSITIPDSVTWIDEGAFYHCSSLTGITIPDSVTVIAFKTFQHCSSLTNVTIPDSVTAIGNSAFYDCTSLTSVTIGNSVTKIGWYAFRDCCSLTSVVIPNSVTNIVHEAFRNCTSLTSVTIPDSVTSIGERAFYGCTSLTSVTIPIRFRNHIRSLFGNTNANFKFYGQQNESLNKNTKKIFITESQLKTLEQLIVEGDNYYVDTTKVKIVKKFLDAQFKRGSMDTMGSDGYPKRINIFAMKGNNGDVVKNLSLEQMVDLLEDKFHHIFTEREKRNRFFRQILKDWYNKKITKEGLLSTYMF